MRVTPRSYASLAQQHDDAVPPVGESAAPITDAAPYYTLGTYETEAEARAALEDVRAALSFGKAWMRLS
jgi:hypothetical protein